MTNTDIFSTVSIRNEGVTPGPWDCQQFGLFYGDKLHVGGTNWAHSKLMEYGMNFHVAKDLLVDIADNDTAYDVCDGLAWAL